MTEVSQSHKTSVLPISGGLFSDCDSETEAPFILGFCHLQHTAPQVTMSERTSSHREKEHEGLWVKGFQGSVSVCSISRLATPDVTEGWEVGSVCVCPGRRGTGLGQLAIAPYLFGTFVILPLFCSSVHSSCEVWSLTSSLPQFLAL